MTKALHRLMQLGAFVAAALSMGRDVAPLQADACAVCMTAKSCTGGNATGTQGCSIPEGQDCVQTGSVCGPS
jgi:hypothetical protein